MRAWYHCRECGHGFAPLDEQLGVAGTPLSPGLREMIARAGAEVPFGKAAALIADLAGVAVSAKTAERSAEASGAAARAAGSAEAAALRARAIRPLPPPAPVPDMLYVEVDGTGVPVRRSETEGRQGKGEDGQRPHPGDQAGPLLHRLQHRTPRQAGDGPGLLQLRGHLRRQGRPRRAGGGRVPAPRRRALPPGRRPRRRRRVDLDHGRGPLPARHPHHRHLPRPRAPPRPRRPPGLHHPRPRRGGSKNAAPNSTPGTSKRSSAPPASTRSTASKPAELDTKLGYFEHNAHRMRYARFSELGMFTGSGAIEGGMQSDRRPARQTIRHALDHRRRCRHHRPAHPARQRPLGRTMASARHPRRPAPAGHLTDPATQTHWPQPRARSSPTKLTCTRSAGAARFLSDPAGSLAGMSSADQAAGAGRVVAEYWAAAEARDWDAFGALLADDVVYEAPQTRERVSGREAYIRFNAEGFPGGWHLAVQRIVSQDRAAVSMIEFRRRGPASPGCASSTSTRPAASCGSPISGRTPTNLRQAGRIWPAVTE